MDNLVVFIFLEFLSYSLLFIVLSIYIVQNLQWYNYSILRVATKHHKIYWHLYYFLLPISIYVIFDIFDVTSYYWLIFYAVYLPMFFKWFYALDKKLVLTKRVQRYMLTSIVFFSIFVILCEITLCYLLNPMILSLITAFIVSSIIEKIIFLRYKREAIDKLKQREDLIVVAITASYGKTSIKNYLYQALGTKYRVYASPKSVNTEVGIIQDINNSLPDYAEIYIVEAGARDIGDVKKIMRIVNPKYVVLGKIGSQHIEYFGNINNIIKAKSEILEPQSVEKAFIHGDNRDMGVADKLSASVVWYTSGIKNIVSTLSGVSFELMLNGKYYSFEAPLLGGFNCQNLSAVIHVSKEFGLNIPQIQKVLKKLKPTENRLQLVQTSPKVILDDSYNSNLEGMKQAIELCKTHDGRRVIVTPGLVESDDESNIEIAQNIDEVFDMAIITGELNSKLISSHLKSTHKIILKEKSQLQSILQSNTKAGDLILFANDAPNFI
jgi:UDP-N-acetylmuramoyl-tripeptide--D-alanyl-D-alanine ligase